MKRVAWILVAGILWMLSPAGGYGQDVGEAPVDAPEDTRNYAGPGLGARFSPGVNTEFLEPWGLDAFVTKGTLIFRHGPRDLEKAIIVTLAQPVRVRAVSFGTVYEDIVRCPIGCEVFASETGIENSYRRVGGTNQVRGDRTLIPIEPPVVARYLKFAFTDSGGGSRITGLGVYTGTPERVRQAGGFEPWPPGPQPDWITPDAITAAAREGGPRGDMELTFYATGLDYSAPAIPGEGSLLERFHREGGTVARRLERLPHDLPLYRALGATAVESYVRWNFIEERQGVFDFSVHDAVLAQLREHGLKWVPLVIAGPAYSLPAWFRESPDFLGFRCLEHGQENGVASIWNPRLRPYVERFLQAFFEHYAPHADSIQSVILGISGIFGENLYPHDASRDWTTNAFGDYHTHSGWWAGDAHAQASFRAYLKARYKTVAALNAAWGTTWESFDAITPQAPETLSEGRARYDFLDWYNSSMTEYLEFWLRTARKHTRGKLLICVGGHGLPRVGADFSATARLAARYGAGIRITNEGPDYRWNFAMTRWISTAARFYRAPLGIEPASLQVDARSIAARVFNARTSGAEELFCYPSSWTNKPGYLKLAEHLHYLRRDTPVTSVAFRVPRTHLMAVGEVDYLGQMAVLREATDFDAVDAALIRDDALKSYQLLILGQGNVEEAAMLERICRWVYQGGILVRLGRAPLRTVDQRDDYERWFLQNGGQEARLPSGAVSRRVGGGYVVDVRDVPESAEAFAALMDQVLVDATRISRRFVRPPRLVGAPRGVYVAATRGDLLFLNTTGNQVDAEYEAYAPGGIVRRGSISLPPQAMRSVAYPR